MNTEENNMPTAREQNAMPKGSGISCLPEIAIYVKNGTAIISGTVCSNDDIVEAEDAVNLMSGIDRVFNLVKTG